MYSQLPDSHRGSQSADWWELVEDAHIPHTAGQPSSLSITKPFPAGKYFSIAISINPRMSEMVGNEEISVFPFTGQNSITFWASIVLTPLNGFSSNQSDKCHFSSFPLTSCTEQSYSMLAGPMGWQKGGFAVGPLYRRILIQSLETENTAEEPT